MKNKSISDFVAASMDAVLKSDQHKSLFNKFAFDSNVESKPLTGQEEVEAIPGSPIKEDPYQDIPMPKDSSPAWDSDKHSAKECATCGGDKDNCYCYADDGMADDETPPMPDLYKQHSGTSVSSSMPEDSMSAEAALNVAIDGLLTASAALDAVGLGDGSAVSLKLASLVVQAKKEMSSKKEESSKKMLAKKKPANKMLAKKMLDKKMPAKKMPAKKMPAKKEMSGSASKSTSEDSKKSLNKKAFYSLGQEKEDLYTCTTNIYSEPEYAAKIDFNKVAKNIEEMCAEVTDLFDLKGCKVSVESGGAGLSPIIKVSIKATDPAVINTIGNLFSTIATGLVQTPWQCYKA
jgi:hypothetical protein